MRLSIALRRLAVVAATSALVAGLPVSPALADGTVTNVSPTGGVNTNSHTVQFDTSEVFLAVPPPTVSFVRTADATDVIEVAPDDTTVVGQHFTVTADFTRRNPGPWNIKVEGLVGAAEQSVDSCTACFTVLGFAPNVSAISPTSARITQSATNFTVTGTNFTDDVYCVSGDCTGQPTVTVSGTGITLANQEDQLGDPLPATATTIPLTIAVDASAASGFRTVTVTNTDGKTDSCTDCLLVTPNVSGISYPENAPGTNSYGQGAISRTVTVSGQGFQPGATVAFAAPTGITINSTDVVNATTINVDVTLNQVDSNAPTVASHAVTVTNPDGGVSNTNQSFVIAAGPKLTSVSPPSRGRGETSNITLSGSGFSTAGVTVTIPDVTVNSYGTPTATSVTINVTIGSGLNIAGLRDVTIMNNNNKGQYTCANCFAIDNLQVSGVSPSNVLNDEPNQLTITGSGFASDATVTLVKSGTGAGTTPDIEGTSVSVNGEGTQITATFATTGVSPGTWKPRVTNPTSNPGTGTCTCTLNIAAPAPNVTAVSPTSRGAGAQDETITITGTGFAPGASVTFSNPGVHVQGSPVVTPTQITAVIDIDENATPDDTAVVPPTPTVSVTNTDAQSDSADFRVNTGPSAAGIDEPARAQGTSATVTISGEDFVEGATVLIAPATGLTVGAWTFTSGNGVNEPDTLAATVTVASDAPTGARSITVRNPDGGRSTCDCTLTVNAPPTIDTVTPDKAASNATTAVTITGTGFLPGVTVTASGAGVTANVTNVTPTALSVNLVIASGAATGLRNLTVTNTDDGAATKTDAVKVFTVPGAPTGAAAVRGTTPGTAKVTWTAPASDGNDPITGYTVTSNPGGVTSTVGPEAREATVSGLTNGTSYTFTVVATNAAGNSAASNTTNAVVPATVPDAPTNVVASAGNAEATVTWSVPASNGGAAVTSYTVTSSPGGITKTVQGAATTTALVEGLTNGTAYTFSVVATNDMGNSVASNASNSVTPATVPNPPTNVSASASDSSALVSWNAPLDNGGSTITSYTVTSSPGGHTAMANGEATSVTVSGLTNGTPYTFTVKASNAKGTSAASEPSAEVTPFTIPGAPTNVVATAGASAAHVTWTAPTATNGSPITGYTVTASPGGVSKTVDGSTLEADVTGLAPGTSYTFTVVATNAAGNSAPSAASNAVTPFDVPGAPTGVSAARGDQSATVSWTAPASNGGSPLTGFVITASPGGATATVNNGAATSGTITGLTNGTSYTFTVAAKNSGGTGAESAPSNAVVPAGVPLAPPSVTATAGHGEATVSWTAANGNGSPVTSYTVTASPGGAVRTVTGLSTTFTGLSNGVEYTFAVRATNAVGTGPATVSNAVRPTWVTRLTEGASTVVVATNSARVFGRLTRSDGVGIVGASIAIFRRTTPSSSYQFVRTVTTGSGGAWSTTFTVLRNTYFQAKFAGSTGFDAVNSPVRLTLARYRVTASYSVSGTTLTVRGGVTPNAAGRNVFLQYRRRDGSYATIRYGAIASDGTYRLTRSLRRGTYTLRVLVNSSSTNYTGFSLPKSVTVR